MDDQLGRERRQAPDASNDDEHAPAPFPIGQVFSLALCKFSEPIAFNSVVAYAFPMSQWLHDGDATNASFYAGALVSAYALGEVLTSIFWGTISDRVGRKPVVLSGLCGVGLSCIMFGLAKSYWIALLARLLGGMLNGNVSVMQTMLAEQIKRPEHEPTAYAAHPFVWFAGGSIGSAVGGCLSQPAHFYPGLFPPNGLFAQYPYLLPNIVSAVAIGCAIAQGAFFLDETNPMILQKRTRMKGAPNLGLAADHGEASPLLSDSASQHPEIGSNEASASTKLSGASEERLPHAISHAPIDERHDSSGTKHPADSRLPSIRSNDMLRQQPSFEDTFNCAVVMLITSFVLCSYHGMAYGGLLPIYLQDKPCTESKQLDLSGGLGYDVHDVGIFMAANGVIAMLVQVVVFPPFVERVGIWRSYFIMTTLYPISYILIPFLSLLSKGPAQEGGIYGIMVLQNHLNIIIPPCILILIKNATPSPLVLGKVNGATMAFICAARTIAPPLQGIVYTKEGSAAAWFTLAGIATAAIIQLLGVSRARKPERGSVNLASAQS